MAYSSCFNQLDVETKEFQKRIDEAIQVKSNKDFTLYSLVGSVGRSREELLFLSRKINTCLISV